MHSSVPPPSGNRSLVITLVLVLLFTTPYTRLWSGTHLPWYTPYILWFCCILLMLWSQRPQRKPPDTDDS